MTAGDSTAQLAHEVQGRQREEREKLLEELKKAGGNCLLCVPVQSSLAMKADLNIPWNKLRMIRMYSSIITVFVY